MELFSIIIFLAITLWVATTQNRVRNINLLLSIIICTLLGPLFGWIVIAAFWNRRDVA